MPSYASTKDIFNTEYAAKLKPKVDRPVIGVNPPAAKDGEQWVMSGTRTYQTNNPKSGNTVNTVPVWTQAKATATEKKQEQQQQPATSTSPIQQAVAAEAVPEDLAKRNDAYERAQEFQKINASIPKTPPPNDPQSPTYYKDLQAYGRAYIDDYLRGQDTEQKRVELGVAENAYYGNQALRRIDPKSMNISQADTQQDTLDFLKKLKGLIT